MIIFSLVIAYLMFSFVFSLMKTQDEKHKIKVERDRQRTELREALKQAARMRQ